MNAPSKEKLTALFKPYRKRRALKRLSLLSCLMFGAGLLGGCATIPAPVLPQIPDSLRAACDRPDYAGVSTLGELAGFSIRQEAALAVCDGRRAAVVALVDGHKAIVTPRPWWRVWP